MGEVRAGAHGAEKDSILHDVVAGYGCTESPAAVNVGTVTFAANLLAVAIDATEVNVDVLALQSDTAFTTGEERVALDLFAVFIEFGCGL